MPLHIHALMFTASILASTPQTIQLHLTTHQLPPYSYKEAGGIKGTAVEVVECATETLKNVELKITILPWKRAQYVVKHKQADGFFAASHNHERDKYAILSTIIAEQSWTWYLLKNNETNPNNHSFKEEKVVSSFLGANMQKWLQSHKYNLSSFPPADNKNLLKLLMHKRLDAILANDQVMNSLIEDAGASKKIISIKHSNKPLGVYFSNDFLTKHPLFLTKFNTAVNDCRHKKSTP